MVEFRVAVVKATSAAFDWPLAFVYPSTKRQQPSEAPCLTSTTQPPQGMNPLSPSTASTLNSSPFKFDTVNRSNMTTTSMRAPAIPIHEDENSNQHSSPFRDDPWLSVTENPSPTKFRSPIRISPKKRAVLGTSPRKETSIDYDDDTRFSTFSAVPDFTTFASRREESPSKQLQTEMRLRDSSPMRPSATPSKMREPGSPSSPTPRKAHHDDNDNTDLIMDFTEQFNLISSHAKALAARRDQSPQRNGSNWSVFSAAPTPRRSTATPQSRHLVNLLDFDIPPAPTPRSLPTVSSRELETLKSGYLSEISSLKASLSGKEAEIASLAKAVGDAERRVGEALESVHKEKTTREELELEKEQWEKRGKEMEAVLREVKEEILREEREKAELSSRLEEAERRKDEAETKAAEAETRAAGMSQSQSSTSPTKNRDIEVAVEKVARELHALYKAKHETKVAALKKSYESRWEKKVKEQASKIEDLSKEVEELKTGRDSTLTTVLPPNIADKISKELENERAARLQGEQENRARIAGLTSELETFKRDNADLHANLASERREKGELVAAVEEMLSISALAATTNGGDSVRGALAGVENLRGSIRVSGLPMPRGRGNSFSSDSGIPMANGRRSVSEDILRRSTNTIIGGSRTDIRSEIEKMGAGRV